MSELSEAEFKKASAAGAVKRKTLREKQDARPKPALAPVQPKDNTGALILQANESLGKVISESAELSQERLDAAIEALATKFKGCTSKGREPVRLQVNRNKEKLITSIDVIPIKIKA